MTNEYVESMSFLAEQNGVSTVKTFEREGGIVLDELTQVIKDFLVAAGYTYVTQVVVVKDGGAEVVSEY